MVRCHRYMMFSILCTIGHFGITAHMSKRLNILRQMCSQDLYLVQPLSVHLHNERSVWIRTSYKAYYVNGQSGTKKLLPNMTDFSTCKMTTHPGCQTGLGVYKAAHAYLQVCQVEDSKQVSHLNSRQNLLFISNLVTGSIHIQ